MKPGESWAYRARQADPLVEVKVVRHGTQRPARVLVRFADDEFEGREEWVPPTRLKTPWDQAESLAAREARWERVRQYTPDDRHWCAAEHVFLELIDDELALLEHPSGAVRILDADGLADTLQLRTAELDNHPYGFTEDGALIAPWPVTERVAAAAARLHPNRILRHVAREEREAQHHAIHGKHYTSGRGKTLERHYIQPERSIEYDEDFSKPIREVLRSWCGAESAERFDELAELRKEIRRVGDVAQAAIDALRAAGHDAQAARLQRDLGMPVEMLRTEDSEATGAE